MKFIIYDYETLGIKPETAPIVSVAAIEFDPDRFLQGDGYDYLDTVSKANFMKFDVEYQVKQLGKKIEIDTLNWWKTQSKEAQRAIAPSKDDKKLDELYPFFTHNFDCLEVDLVYTRGNMFDVSFTKYAMKSINRVDPFGHWKIRDTRSMLDGLLYGSGMENSFIPTSLIDSFIKHDPRHDVVMDLMRMQTVIRKLQ